LKVRKDILELSESIKEEVVKWRRHFHMYPELSGREFNTSEFVSEKLKEFGVDEVIESFAGSTAVVATIRGRGKNCVALRADMDALPMEEKGDKAYISRKKGIMHACGHDAHTAMLLGAAKVLCAMKDRLLGNVRLIFQPCEERHDCKGAKHLVENGAVDGVSAIYALHVFPDLECGKVGTRIGPFLASSDEFEITIKGKSTHAARPHEGVDPILIAAQVINSLHHIVSRRIDPLNPAVLTIGRIEGGYAPNIIPDSVRMEGTIRTLNFKDRGSIPGMIENTLKHISLAYGGDYSFSMREGTPPLINDEVTTGFAIGKMKELLGDENVVILEKPTMGGEDFSAYLEKVPGTFIRLGTRNEEKGIIYPLHNSLFDIDEDALPIGVSVLSYLAVKWLEVNA
jgi:amidohydrolase